MKAMARTSFAYTTYIESTPADVWQGLTDPAYTTRYWRHARAGGKSFPSDWKKGSTWDLVHEDVGLVVRDPAQVILESEPFHRLAYTWHTFTPEWARCVGLADEHGSALARRAALEGRVRHRGRRRGCGAPHRGPRRFRTGEPGPPCHLGGLAGRPLEPQDAARDRVGVADRLSPRRRQPEGAVAGFGGVPDHRKEKLPVQGACHAAHFVIGY